MKDVKQEVSPLLLTVSQAAKALGLSRWTVRKWITDGRISSVKLGKRRMLELAVLQQIIENGRSLATAENAVGKKGENSI